MVKLNELQPAEGSVKKRKRVGRGDSSGQGGTAGRGHKGQNSRSGGSTRTGFEGGQTPLYRRFPKKRGFHNLFTKEYAVINIADLNAFADGETVSIDLLREKNIITNKYKYLKVLGEGEVSRKVIVKAHKFSKSAMEKLVKAKIQVEVVD